MSSAEAAFGFFSTKLEGEEKSFPGIKPDSWLSPGQASLVKGEFLVNILAPACTDKEIGEFAAAVEPRIPGHGTVRPQGLGWLPTEGQVPSSRRYIKGPLAARNESPFLDGDFWRFGGSGPAGRAAAGRRLSRPSTESGRRSRSSSSSDSRRLPPRRPSRTACPAFSRNTSGASGATARRSKAGTTPDAGSCSSGPARSPRWFSGTRMKRPPAPGSNGPYLASPARSTPAAGRRRSLSSRSTPRTISAPRPSTSTISPSGWPKR